MGQPGKILVRAPNWVGDQILAYPFFYFLRRAYPRAHILSVCVDWVKEIQFKGLVNDVFVLPKSPSPDLIAKFKNVTQASDQIKKLGEWDLAFSLPNSFSAAWLLFRAGAARRRGYAVEGRSLLLNERVKWDPDPGRHRAQAYLDLLEPNTRPAIDAKLFWGAPPESDLDPVTPGLLPCFDPQKEWSEFTPLEPPVEPYWVLAPGSQAEARTWPLDYYQGLVQILNRETGLKGVVLGTAGESALAERLCEGSNGKLENWAGKGSISSLWRLFRGARFTVCNDSGLAHVASLCGSPVQIVWGAGDPRRTRPIGPGRVQVRANPVDCWPCEKNVCHQPPGGFIKCLRGIPPDAIWDEIRVGFGISS